MTEAEVARLKQEVDEAEAVLDRLLQEMRAEEATFKADSAAADVTTDRYQAMLTAHTQQWQTHKQEYDEAHRAVAGKKREAELAAQLLAAEQSTRAKQAKAEETEEQLRAAQQEQVEAEREEQKLREQQGRSRSPQQQRGFPQGARPPQQGYGQPQGVPYHATSHAEYHRLRRQGMVAPPGGFPQQGGFPQPGGFPYPGRYQQQRYGGSYQGGYERGPRGSFPFRQQPFSYPGGFPGDLPDGRPGGYQRYTGGGFGTSREYGVRGDYGDRPYRQ